MLFYGIAALFLAVLAALCSGLTVGYLSIDDIDLEITLQKGTNEEKRQASVIKQLTHNKHYLMSTLLLANAIALEALPICVEKITGGIWAILISTIIVILGCEIIPQAICTGSSQLRIAELMTPIIKFLMLIFYLIAFPLGKLLDRWFGKHHIKRYQRRDIKGLFALHQVEKIKNQIELDEVESKQENDNLIGLKNDEIRLMTSIIDLREKRVEDVMIKIEKIFMVNVKEKISTEFLRKIQTHNFSKIPVYEKNRNQVIGILKSKQLIKISEKDPYKVTLKKINLGEPLIVSKDTNLLDMLMLFQQKKQSIALISNQTNFNTSGMKQLSNQIVKESKIELIGLVAIKDIFEEVLNTNLEDDDIHLSILKNIRNQKIQKIVKKKGKIAIINQNLGQFTSIYNKNIINKDINFDSENVDNYSD